MTQQEMFGGAKWIGSPEETDGAIFIRKSFDCRDIVSAKLTVIGFGTFVAYMNGKRISDDYFLPLNSEYEKTEFPIGEELSGYRVYATEYDVTDMLLDGKNTFALHLGAGWYTGAHYGIRKIYGGKKAIFSLSMTDRLGNRAAVISDGTERWRESYVKKSDLHLGESHDYNGFSESMLTPNYDDSEWGRVTFSKPVMSEYELTDCPSDKVCETLSVRCVYECGDYRIMDCGSGTSGYPVVITRAGYNGEVKIVFSEGLQDGGRELDADHIHGQEFNIVCDGGVREAYPQFTWLGFRYFKVIGECEIREVKVVHSAVEVCSSFESDNDVLNWTYNAFINTQLTNMHRGIPSDCPHIERLGYTGDGQLVCRTVMLTLNAKKFYEKWIKDIADCQDKLTGRVQYTAPFFYCGGGPGGWGSAIITVPYEFYKYYGDDTYIKQLYPGMLRFLKFLSDSSECDVVVRYKEGVWCLGDWAGPQESHLPTPFVNTCFRVICTRLVIEISKIIGREENIPRLESEIERCKRAINLFYFNSFSRDDCYCANAQGASAFALDIGLGTEITRRKLIEHYEKLGYYDTGIFGTELVTRKLFDLGRGDIAYTLLTASEPHGFGKWYNMGSTTLREYFGPVCRSFSHPMFGAVVATYFEYILGIKQREGTAGYTDVIISPAIIDGLGSASGHITVPRGKIAVSYKTENGRRKYTVEIPDGIHAVFAQDGVSVPLSAGKNVI